MSGQDDQERDGTVNRDSAEGVRWTFDALETEALKEAGAGDGEAPATEWSVLEAARFQLAGLREIAVQLARTADALERIAAGLEGRR